MKKFKLASVIILLLFVGVNLEKERVKSKEIELPIEKIGNFYKEYIITKQKNGINLKNYFTNKDIFIDKEEVKSIINLEEDYELLQLDNQIYLKNVDKINLKKGIFETKIDEYYLFSEDNKFGILDKNLNIIVEPIYDGLFGDKKSGFLLAQKGKMFGYLDLKGDVVVPFEYEMGSIERSGLMIVKKNGKVGVVNLKNEVVIDFIYDGVYYNKDKFIGFKKNEYFFVDSLGKVEKIDVSWMGVQKDNKLFYEKDNLFGIFEFEKKIITKNIYSEISQDYSKLIIAKKVNEYGLIDNRGETKLPFIYNYILPVGENYFKVGTEANGYMSLVNQNGKVITEQIYDDYIELNEKNIIGMKKNKFILLNQNGKELEEFDSIINFNKEMLLYIKEKKNILRKL